MSFKLIIATGYFAAAVLGNFSEPPTTGSLQSPAKFETEQACIDAAIDKNKQFKADMEKAKDEARKARNIPLDAALAHHKAKDMDALKQKDWDQINLERKKISDATPLIPISIALCADLDSFWR